MATKPTIIVYGNDQGANNVLDPVAKAAEGDAALHTVRIPGLNVPVPENMRSEVRNSAAAVFGISSGVPEASIAAQALAGNPSLAGHIFFVEDFPGSSGINDQAILQIGKQVRLCTIMALPPDAPERRIYQSVHTVGYPDHWRPSMENIQAGTNLRKNGEVQKRRRGSEEQVPVSPSDVVVYLSGFKNPQMEAEALQQLLSIGSIGNRPVVIHFRPHPGERNRADLQEAIIERDALLKEQWEIASPEIIDAGQFTDSRLIGVADVTVAHPGATSNFFAAAMRKNMVCSTAFVTEQDRSSSSYDYTLTDRNVLTVAKLTDIGAAIAALAQDDSPESLALRKKQEKNALPFDARNTSSYGQNVLAVMQHFSQ